MRIKKLLIANRGEIAVRIHRSATLMAIQTVGVYSESDQQSRHWQITDEAVPLAGKGAQPYLDHQALIQAAKKSGCDALHPGYGFLSESAEFATAVTQADITFIGPEAAHLQQLGDKTQARLLAEQLGIPVQPAMRGDLQAAKRFLKQTGRPILIKANAGGGGRGMRYVKTSGSSMSSGHSASWRLPRRSVTTIFMWRLGWPTPGILKFRYWAMPAARRIIYTIVIAPYSGASRRSLKLPPHPGLATRSGRSLPMPPVGSPKA